MTHSGLYISERVGSQTSRGPGNNFPFSELSRLARLQLWM